MFDPSVTHKVTDEATDTEADLWEFGTKLLKGRQKTDQWFRQWKNIDNHYCFCLCIWFLDGDFAWCIFMVLCNHM